MDSLKIFTKITNPFLLFSNCPHTLTAAISRAVYHSVRNIDISEVQDTKTETDEENKEEDEEKGSDIIAEEKDIGLFNYNLIKIIIIIWGRRSHDRMVYC